MCFLVPTMNSDSLRASQLANMKQVAACNIQISREALNRLDRNRCLSASMITTVSQFGWKNKSPLIEHKTSRIPKSLRSLSLFPPTIWCLERGNISTCAAKLAGRIYKKKKLPATDGADQLLAGNRYLFPTMMIDCFNRPTRGCSAPEPATDGNNAPLPLKKARCSPCGTFPSMFDKQSSLWRLHDVSVWESERDFNASGDVLPVPGQVGGLINWE